MTARDPGMVSEQCQTQATNTSEMKGFYPTHIIAFDKVVQLDGQPLGWLSYGH